MGWAVRECVLIELNYVREEEEEEEVVLIAAVAVKQRHCYHILRHCINMGPYNDGVLLSSPFVVHMRFPRRPYPVSRFVSPALP